MSQQKLKEEAEKYRRNIADGKKTEQWKTLVKNTECFPESERAFFRDSVERAFGERNNEEVLLFCDIAAEVEKYEDERIAKIIAMVIRLMHVSKRRSLPETVLY